MATEETVNSEIILCDGAVKLKRGGGVNVGGVKPVVGDTVEVEYTGYLCDEDNTEFDHSLNGYPFKFTVGDGKVIAGWEHAILEIFVGDSLVELWVRSDFAYGESGDSRGLIQIPPNMDLRFDIKLIGIVGKSSQNTGHVNPELARLAQIRLEREKAQQQRQTKTKTKPVVNLKNKRK